MYTHSDLCKEAIPSKLGSLNYNALARKLYYGVCANIGKEFTLCFLNHLH